MVKICTSPSFTSGQCPDELYYVAINFGGVQWRSRPDPPNSPDGYIVNASGVFNAVGVISEMYVIWVDSATGVRTRINIGDSNPYPQSGYNQVVVVDRGGERIVDLGLNGFPGFKLLRFAPTLYGQDCGNPPEVCVCEVTDETITCSGQTGGICCIAKSKIAGWCAALTNNGG